MAHLLKESTIGGKQIASIDDLPEPIDISSKAEKSYVDLELTTKVDKEQVLTNVPSGAKFTDTIYSHPSTHPASMIVESTIKRFVSDAEKAEWNSKSIKNIGAFNSHQELIMYAITEGIPTGQYAFFMGDAGHASLALVRDAGTYYEGMAQGSDGLYVIFDVTKQGQMREYGELYARDIIASLDDIGSIFSQLDDKVDSSRVLTDVPSGAKFTDTVYTHPTTAGNKHIPTGGASGQVLKYSASGTATWQADNDTITTINGKTGAIAKADIVALGIPAQDTVYTHPSNHPYSILTGAPTKLSDFSKDINFDERYYTESETDTLLSDKTDKTYVDSELDKKQNSLGYTPVNKSGDTITGQLGVESATFPVINIARDTSGTGGGLYGGARLQRKTTNPTDGVGIGFYFQAPNSNKTMTHAGMFGGALGTIQAGSEKGEIVISPSYAGQDPYLRRDLIVRAISVSKAEAELNGKLKTDQTLASDSNDTVATKKYVDDGLDSKVNNSRILTDVPANAKFTDTNTITTINGKTGAISKADIVALGIPSQEGGIAGGVAFFSGNGLETTIAHNLDAVPTSAFCFPTNNPGGYLGEVWVRMDEVNLYIGNTGTYEGAMSWTAFEVK